MIKAVFTMMMFICAERGADWCLHLTAAKEMLPYSFCCRACQLCLIWSLLLVFYGGIPKNMSGTIPKRRMCHASCPRALDWYLERYVHRDNVRVL